LADSCVSSGLVFWKGTERLANWVVHPGSSSHIRRETETTEVSPPLAYLEKCISNVLKKDAAK